MAQMRKGRSEMAARRICAVLQARAEGDKSADENLTFDEQKQILAAELLEGLE